VTGLEEAKLLISFRGYDLKHVEHRDEFIGVLTSDTESGKDILIRVANARIGVDRVRMMRKTLDTLKIERGILFPFFYLFT
jgi:hypothetical protein